MIKQKLRITLTIAFSLLLTVATLPLSGFNSENSAVSAIANQPSEIDNQFQSVEKRSIFNEKIYSNATLEDDFVDDGIIVVLDERISSFSASRNSGSLNSMFEGIETKAIKDLSALPESYLTVDGRVDAKILIV